MSFLWGGGDAVIDDEIVSNALLASVAVYKADVETFLSNCQHPFVNVQTRAASSLRFGRFIMLHTEQTDIYIAIRGTKNAHDLQSDMDMRPSDSSIGLVHSGFYSRMMELPLVHLVALAKAGKRLVFCGHSLGGSVAALAAVRVRSVLRADKSCDQKASVLCVTFGAPLIGDKAFARQMDCRYFHHYVNRDDIIPHLLTMVANAFGELLSTCLSFLSSQTSEAQLPRNVADALSRECNELFQPGGRIWMIESTESSTTRREIRASDFPPSNFREFSAVRAWSGHKLSIYETMLLPLLQACMIQTGEPNHHVCVPLPFPLPEVMLADVRPFEDMVVVTVEGTNLDQIQEIRAHLTCCDAQSLKPNTDLELQSATKLQFKCPMRHKKERPRTIALHVVPYAGQSIACQVLLNVNSHLDAFQEPDAIILAALRLYVCSATEQEELRRGLSCILDGIPVEGLLLHVKEACTPRAMLNAVQHEIARRGGDAARLNTLGETATHEKILQPPEKWMAEISGCFPGRARAQYLVCVGVAYAQLFCLIRRLAEQNIRPSFSSKPACNAIRQQLKAIKTAGVAPLAVQLLVRDWIMAVARRAHDGGEVRIPIHRHLVDARAILMLAKDILDGMSQQRNAEGATEWIIPVVERFCLIHENENAYGELSEAALEEALHRELDEFAQQCIPACALWFASAGFQPNLIVNCLTFTISALCDRRPHLHEDISHWLCRCASLSGSLGNALFAFATYRSRQEQHVTVAWAALSVAQAVLGIMAEHGVTREALIPWREVIHNARHMLEAVEDVHQLLMDCSRIIHEDITCGEVLQYPTVLDNLQAPDVLNDNEAVQWARSLGDTGQLLALAADFVRSEAELENGPTKVWTKLGLTLGRVGAASAMGALRTAIATGPRAVALGAMTGMATFGASLAPMFADMMITPSSVRTRHDIREQAPIKNGARRVAQQASIYAGLPLMVVNKAIDTFMTLGLLGVNAPVVDVIVAARDAGLAKAEWKTYRDLLQWILALLGHEKSELESALLLEQKLVCELKSRDLSYDHTVSHIVTSWDEAFAGTELGEFPKHYRALLACRLKIILGIHLLRGFLNKLFVVTVSGSSISGKTCIVNTLAKWFGFSGKLMEPGVDLPHRSTIPRAHFSSNGGVPVVVIDTVGTNDMEKPMRDLTQEFLQLTCVQIFVVDCSTRNEDSIVNSALRYHTLQPDFQGPPCLTVFNKVDTFAYQDDVYAGELSRVGDTNFLEILNKNIETHDGQNESLMRALQLRECPVYAPRWFTSNRVDVARQCLYNACLQRFPPAGSLITGENSVHSHIDIAYWVEFWLLRLFETQYSSEPMVKMIDHGHVHLFPLGALGRFETRDDLLRVWRDWKQHHGGTAGSHCSNLDISAPDNHSLSICEEVRAADRLSSSGCELVEIFIDHDDTSPASSSRESSKDHSAREASAENFAIGMYAWLNRETPPVHITLLAAASVDEQPRGESNADEHAPVQLEKAGTFVCLEEDITFEWSWEDFEPLVVCSFNAMQELDMALKRAKRIEPRELACAVIGDLTFRQDDIKDIEAQLQKTLFELAAAKRVGAQREVDNLISRRRKLVQRLQAACSLPQMPQPGP